MNQLAVQAVAVPAKGVKMKIMDANFWNDCPLVEMIPGKVSGRPVLNDTRVPVDTITEAAELDMSPEEIASDYRLKVSDVKQVLAYYARHSTPTLVP